MRVRTRQGSRGPLRMVRRRRVATGLLAFAVVGALAGRSGSPAGAQTAPRPPQAAVAPQATPTGVVDVVQVSGWLDPVLVDFLRGAIHKAATAASSETV